MAAIQISELVVRAVSYLEESRYSQSTCELYVREWRRLASFCEERGIPSLSHEAANDYLLQAGLAGPGLTNRRRARARAVRCVEDLSNGRIPRPKYCVGDSVALPEGMARALEEYERSLVDGGADRSTVRKKASIVRRMLGWLSEDGVEDIDEVGAAEVLRYTSTLSSLAPQSRSASMYVLRHFARHLATARGGDGGLERLFPVIRANRESALPSHFDCDEMGRLLAASGKSGKRPRMYRAVIMLAMMLGLRVSDIRKLRFDELDLANWRISTVQAKTGRPLVLPLPEEVALAIADYAMNERPECDCPQVFVRPVPPYGPLSEADGLYRVMTRAIADSGVSPEGRHHGLHALRHSAALVMLGGGVAYHVVGAVLGHSDSNVTRSYLRVDVDALRPLALEVPAWK